MKEKDFNGYSFDEKEQRKEMKYVVITHGELDSNGAYAFKSKTSLKKHIESSYRRDIYAIFEVKDITDNF